MSRLQVAWRYSLRGAAGVAQSAPAEDAASAAQRAAEATGPAPRRRTRLAASQVTPLMVGDRLFLTTPYGRAVALDATTGREIWSTPIPGPGQPSLRGVEYWPGDGVAGPRIFFGTRDGRLFALDAQDGQPARQFGADGVVNLATPEILQGGDARFYGMTSPPVVFRNLVITGAAVQEFPPLGAAGDVRAWDARTGKLVWTFHSVPRRGERFHDTWAPGSAENRSGANVWGFMTVDAERGLLYMPFGAPAFDRYGGDRHGDNLFSTSLVAVDAATGRYRWHFQVVRHDIWDNDLQAPPLLFDATTGGTARACRGGVVEERPAVRAGPRDRQAAASGGLSQGARRATCRANARRQRNRSRAGRRRWRARLCAWTRWRGSHPSTRSGASSGWPRRKWCRAACITRCT